MEGDSGSQGCDTSQLPQINNTLGLVRMSPYRAVMGYPGGGGGGGSFRAVTKKDWYCLDSKVCTCKYVPLTGFVAVVVVGAGIDIVVPVL